MRYHRDYSRTFYVFITIHSIYFSNLIAIQYICYILLLDINLRVPKYLCMMAYTRNMIIKKIKLYHL